MSQTRFAMWFLLLASTMTILASATFAPALPAMTMAFKDLPQAEFWVKMTVTLPGLVIALLAPLAGSLVDRWDGRRLLLATLMLFALSGLLGYLWQASLWLILLSRALMGLAVAFIMVSCTTIAGRLFQGPNFARYMGMQAAFGGFGGVVFLSIAGVLADIHWTWVFAIFGLALLVLPGVWCWVHIPSAPQPIDEQARPTHWLSKAVLLCCALAFVEIVVLYGLTIHLPFYLSQFEASATEIGLVIAAFLLAMSVVSTQYGRLRQHFSLYHTHLIGWVNIALGFGLLGQVAAFTWVVVASLWIGVGLGMIRPNLVIWLFEQVSPKLRGKAMGVLTTCYFMGQFASPLLLEPLISELSYPDFFTVFAASIGVGVVVVMVGTKRIAKLQREA
jgi:MFS family permease